MKTHLLKKNKVHVDGELVLVCFSTLKVKYFAYLSLQLYLFKFMMCSITSVPKGVS